MKTLKKKNIFLDIIRLKLLCLSLVLTSCGKHNLDLTDENQLVPTLQITSSIQDGRFSSPPQFELSLNTSSENAEILYCVNAGVVSTQYCCDPLTEGFSEKGNKVSSTAGATDGKYCLAFIGYTDSETSKVEKVLFEIDTSGPDVSIATNSRMIQSSEYLNVSFDSEDLGRPGFFFSAINYSSSQGADCDTINSEANFLSNGIDFDKDASPDTIDMSGEYQNFSTPLRGKELLQYGDNYIYFALVDSTTDPMRTSCPGIKVVLNDFNVFEFSSNGDIAPNGQGELMAMGGFNSFGGGTYQGSTNTTELQIGILNIIH